MGGDEEGKGRAGRTGKENGMSKTQMLFIEWDGDEAKVRKTPAYKKADNLLKADLLKDTIFELEQEYRAVLHKGLITRRPNR